MILPKSIPQALGSKKVEIGAAESAKPPPSYEAKKASISDVIHTTKTTQVTQQEEVKGTLSPGTSASSPYNLSRGPAPPVPRKPAELIAPSERKKNPPHTQRQDSVPALSSKPQARRQPSNMLSLNPLIGSQKSLSSSPTSNLEMKRSKNLPDRDRSGLPSQSPTSKASSGSRGLLDEDNVGAQSIPSLQPLRRS